MSEKYGDYTPLIETLQAELAAEKAAREESYGKGVTAGKLEALQYTPEERERYGKWVEQDALFRKYKQRAESAEKYAQEAWSDPVYTRLANVEKACAAMCERAGCGCSTDSSGLCDACSKAFSTDAGRDYVHKSEVQAAKDALGKCISYLKKYDLQIIGPQFLERKSALTSAEAVFNGTNETKTKS